MTPTATAISRKGALVLFLFWLAFALAFMDRQILTLLIEPIRRDFGLSDTQIGLVQGVAFAIFYAGAGLPLGWLVDHSNRLRVAAGCIAIWSLATAATGMASGYVQLLFARAGTATAESGCSPAAMSTFPDLFPARSIPRVTSVYMTGPYFGGGLALIAGSVALQYFTAGGGADLPFLGHLSPWRAVYLAIGLPGLLLAVAMLVVREPNRASSPTESNDPVPLSRTLRFAFRESGYLPFYFAAFVFVLSVAFATMAWYPTLAIRSGVGAAATVGRPLGLIFLVCGTIGTLASQLAFRNLTDDKVLPRAMLTIAVVLAIQIPVALALSSVFQPGAAFVLYACAMLCMGALTALMPVALQVGIPGRMRGRIAGLFLLIANLLGSSLGPASVGILSDRFGQTAEGLSMAMAIVLTAGSVIAIALILLTWKRLKSRPAPATILAEATP